MDPFESPESLEILDAMEALEAFTIVQKLEDLLLVSVPRDLTDNDVLRLRRQVLRDIRRFSSRWVLLDFSLVDICDSFFGRFIHSTAKMAQLMGADVIVSGLQDAVIETMIELGMTLPSIHAVLDLDDALALSRQFRRNGAPANAEEGDLDAFLLDAEASPDDPGGLDAFLDLASLTDGEV